MISGLLSLGRLVLWFSICSLIINVSCEPYQSLCAAILDIVSVNMLISGLLRNEVLKLPTMIINVHILFSFVSFASYI